MAQRSLNWFAVQTRGTLTDEEFLARRSDNWMPTQLMELCSGPLFAFAGQLERGEGGALHDQLWLRFNFQKTRSAVTKLLRLKFGPGVNFSLEKCDRKIYHQLKYVSKETDLGATPKVYGRVPGTEPYEGPADAMEQLRERGQGSRSDVRRMKDMVMDNPKVRISDLIEECGHAGTFLPTIAVLRHEGTVKRDSNLAHTATWIYGSPGTGKSRLAEWTYQSLGIEFYRKNSTEYWKHYNGEKGIILSPLLLSLRYV